MPEYDTYENRNASLIAHFPSSEGDDMYLPGGKTTYKKFDR